MKALAFLLAACGTAPSVDTTVVVHALDASQVKAIELFIVQPADGATLTCDALLTAQGVFIEAAVLRSSALVSPSTPARIGALQPGTYFAVAEAYGSEDGVGPRIGQGCAQSEPVVAGATQKLSIVVQ